MPDLEPNHDLRAAVTWQSIAELEDLRYERAINADGSSEAIAKITIDRPQVRNAFRPETVASLKIAFDMARDDGEIGVIILTGEGPDAFCSGGDQKVRGAGGYVGGDGIPRLNILDVQGMLNIDRYRKIDINAHFASQFPNGWSGGCFRSLGC